MINTILIGACVICISGVGLGLGVLFFGKTAKREACGAPPETPAEPCLSQQAGICPIEDSTGAIKMQQKTRLNYYRRSPQHPPQRS